MIIVKTVMRFTVPHPDCPSQQPNNYHNDNDSVLVGNASITVTRGTTNQAKNDNDIPESVVDTVDSALVD
jgi:hypothetical protein